MIPAMTHRLSRYWDQPPRDRVLVDDHHAVMTQATFEALAEYSASIPSGTYEGKMWRCHVGYARNLALKRQGLPPVPEFWVLCWYDVSEKPDCCSIQSREILLV